VENIVIYRSFGKKSSKKTCTTPESAPSTAFISELSNVRHKKTSSAFFSEQTLNINDSEEDDGSATPSKRLCTENLREKEIEGEEMSARVDPLLQDF
jgi:hypothetical protein